MFIENDPRTGQSYDTFLGTIRTTHPRFIIEDIDETPDGWDVNYWDKEQDECDIYRIGYHKFKEWLADKLFDGSLRAAMNYIINEPDWTNDYLKEFTFQNL
jgi:hypothetical protein